MSADYGRTFSAHTREGVKYYGFDVRTSARGIAAAGLATRALAARLGKDWKALLERADHGSPEWQQARDALEAVTRKCGEDFKKRAAASEAKS